MRADAPRRANYTGPLTKLAGALGLGTSRPKAAVALVHIRHHGPCPLSGLSGRADFAETAAGAAEVNPVVGDPLLLVAGKAAVQAPPIELACVQVIVE